MNKLLLDIITSSSISRKPDGDVLAQGPTRKILFPNGLPKNTLRIMSRRIFFLTMVEMGLGIMAILFGTIFTQIHTIT